MTVTVYNLLEPYFARRAVSIHSHKRMMRIPWTAKKTNADILLEGNEQNIGVTDNVC
jgi:hypothetical protein